MSGADDGKTSDFLHFYQTFKFRETENDKIVVSRAKRMQLLMNNLELKQQ